MKDRKDTELIKEANQDDEYLKYRKSYMDQMQEHQGKDSIVFHYFIDFSFTFCSHLC